MLKSRNLIVRPLMAVVAMGMAGTLSAEGGTLVQFHNDHNEMIIISFVKEVYLQPYWSNLVLTDNESFSSVNYRTWRNESGSYLGTFVQPGERVNFWLDPAVLDGRGLGTDCSIPFRVDSKTHTRGKTFEYLAWTSVQSGQRFAGILEPDSSDPFGTRGAVRPHGLRNPGRRSATAFDWVNVPFRFTGFDEPGAVIGTKAAGEGGATAARVPVEPAASAQPPATRTAGAGGFTAARVPVRPAASAQPPATRAAGAGGATAASAPVRPAASAQPPETRATGAGAVAAVPSAASGGAVLGIQPVLDLLQQARRNGPPCRVPKLAVPGPGAVIHAGVAPRDGESRPGTPAWWNEILDTCEYIPGTAILRVKPSAAAGGPSRPGGGAGAGAGMPAQRPWVPPGAPVKPKRAIQPGASSEPMPGSPMNPPVGGAGRRAPKPGRFTPGLGPIAERLEFDLSDCLTGAAAQPEAGDGVGPEQDLATASF